MKTEIKKILIIRTEQIGDYLVSLPAIKALKEKFPQAKIDIVVGPWNNSLAKATPYVDKVIVFNNPFAQRDLTYLDILKIILFKSPALIEFYNEINKENYDLMVSFSERKFNKIFLRFIKAKQKISGTSFTFGEIYEEERCLKILKRLGIQNFSKEIELNYKPEDKKNAKSIIAKYCKKDTKIAIIHLFTPLRIKDWKARYWEELLSYLVLKNKNTLFFIVGTEKAEEVNKILSKIKDKKRIINLLGKTTLLGLFLLIKKSNFFIGPCSGPLYIAKLFNKPLIGLFGPGSGKKWEPKSKESYSLRGRTLEDIKTERVLKKCKKIGLKI